MRVFNLIEKTVKVVIWVGLVISMGAVASDAKLETETKRYEAFDVTVKGQGKPVLLLPGMSSSASVWDATISALKDEYELHVFNLAGFAAVPAAPAEKVGQSFLTFQKESLKQYIQQHNLTDVVVVGHSLGGFLSLWLATEQTENIRGVINVDGLPALGALFASASANDNGNSEPEAQSAPRKFDPMMMAKGMANNTSWHQRIVDDMKSSDPMTSGRAMGELVRMDIRPQLKHINVPTLTIGAPAQGMPYSSYEQSQKNYENQFSNLPKSMNNFAFAKTSKHFIMADEPEWMNQQIKLFLTQL